MQHKVAVFYYCILFLEGKTFACMLVDLCDLPLELNPGGVSPCHCAYLGIVALGF